MGDSTVPVDNTTQVVREFLEPFIAATETALREMAGTEVVAHSVNQPMSKPATSDIAVMIRLRSSTEGAMVFFFPQQTAEALAQRILADVAPDVDDQLIRDCAGEIGNVVTGQVKAMLAESRFRLAFSLPPSVMAADELRPPSDLECVAIFFDCDVGNFLVQLFLPPGTLEGSVPGASLRHNEV